MKIGPIGVNQYINHQKNTNFNGTLRVNCLTDIPNEFCRYGVLAREHALDTNRILEISDATKYGDLPAARILYQLGTPQFPNIIAKWAIAKFEDLSKCWEYAKPQGMVVDYIMNDASELEKVTEAALGQYF